MSSEADVTTKATLRCFDRYRDMVHEQMGEPDPTRDDDNPTSLWHLNWMIEHASSGLISGEFDLAKASRWLGFIQGVLIMKWVTRVDIERDTTRPWFKPETAG